MHSRFYGGEQVSGANERLPRLPQVAPLLSENKNDKLALEWNKWRGQVNYTCALLANVTRTEKGAAEFGLSVP